MPKNFDETLKNLFQADFELSEKDRKLYELATKYHKICESYDRTVCTGPILHDSIQHANSREMALSLQNARKVHSEVLKEALAHQITESELWKAIGRYA
jgi:hypothetical protein